MASIGAIEQFEGATILEIAIERGGNHNKPLFLHMKCKLKDGQTRDVTAYTMSVGHVIHFRVDGMYVPEEELPGGQWPSEKGQR